MLIMFHLKYNDFKKLRTTSCVLVLFVHSAMLPPQSQCFVDVCVTEAEVYSKPFQTSKMEFFHKCFAMFRCCIN